MTSEQLQVGVGRREITPALGTPLMGYPDPHGERRAESVRDPLHATVLLFEQADRRAALVSLDLCILADEWVERLRAAIGEATGVAADHIIVSTIQTHSAPCTLALWGWCEIDHEYCEGVLLPGVVAAAVEAAGSAVPVRVGIAAGPSDVAVNRRRLNERHQATLGQLPWGLVDPTMTVLRFESARGTLANLVHYGAHPTVLHRESRAVSRDWPGIMIDRLERSTGATTLFVNGAVGDIAPRTGSGGAVGDGEASLWEASARAALDALELWRQIKDLRDLELGLGCETFELPYAPLPDRDEAQRRLAEAEARKDEPGRGIAEHRHWQAVLEAHEKPATSGKAYRQTLLGLGPLAFVPMPGEPFAEIVLRLRERSPFQHTLVASTSCGNNGYFWSQEALCRGGYEPWVGRAFGACLLADRIDDVLVDENLRLLRDLYAELHPPLPRM